MRVGLDHVGIDARMLGAAVALGFATCLVLASGCGRVSSPGAAADASAAMDSAGGADSGVSADSGVPLFDGSAPDQVTGADSSPPPRDAGADGPGQADSASDGACPSAATFFDGGCGNPQTDPRNCGVCGHDCDGGACEAGVCVGLPAGVLATGQFAPIALAADGTNVYWLDHGAGIGGSGKIPPTVVGAQVMACTAAGCANHPTVLASLSMPSAPSAAAGGIPVAPSALATDGTNVYWTTGDSVQACAVGGCSCSPTTVAAHLSQPPGVTASAGQIFFSVWANGSPYTGKVGRCMGSSCTGGPTILASGQGGPLALAADTTDVYWADTYGEAGTGSLLRCPTSGCDAGPEQLWAGTVAGMSQPNGVAVDATNLYWTNSGFPGSVMQCAKSDCAGTVVTLASNRYGAAGIAVDGTDVYWSEGSVYKCAIGGCGDSPTLLATGSVTSFQWDAAIAVDATRVYFTQSGAVPDDDRIMWVSK